MIKRLFAGIIGGAALAAAFTFPAQASCRDGGCASGHSVQKHAQRKTAKAVGARSGVSKSGARKKMASRSRQRVHVTFGSGRLIAVNGKSYAGRSLRKIARVRSESAALAVPVQSFASPESASAGFGQRRDVVGLIQQMAPAAGVPTWFALRIAQVESNYNPAMRGAAGEYGVFQIKCPTAKLIGYEGSCAGLLDARTNVQWGLRHLELAIGRSNGNLRMAASKHNGGLGRKTEVASYVAKVF